MSFNFQMPGESDRGLSEAQKAISFQIFLRLLIAAVVLGLLGGFLVILMQTWAWVLIWFAVVIGFWALLYGSASQ